MKRENRKSIKVNEESYEKLIEYAESKGITLGESVAELTKDIQMLKDREMDIVSQNAIALCDTFEAVTNAAKLPQWVKDAIIMTLRPVILQAILNNRPIDLEAMRSAWQIPEGMHLKLSLVADA